MYKVNINVSSHMTRDDFKKLYVQWSPDLTNRSGPGQIFVKPGDSLNRA